MGIPELTPRQRQCVVLVANSFPVKQAAEVLGISQKTVEFHLRTLDRVLGGHDAARLTRFAMCQRWVKPEFAV